jgi:hypothetical protein
MTLLWKRSPGSAGNTVGGSLSAESRIPRIELTPNP